MVVLFELFSFYGVYFGLGIPREQHKGEHRKLFALYSVGILGFPQPRYYS
jgi:hypothetical protein